MDLAIAAPQLSQSNTPGTVILFLKLTLLRSKVMGHLNEATLMNIRAATFNSLRIAISSAENNKKPAFQAGFLNLTEGGGVICAINGLAFSPSLLIMLIAVHRLSFNASGIVNGAISSFRLPHVVVEVG